MRAAWLSRSPATPHADQVLTDEPVRAAGGDDARPAVPDGARVPRARRRCSSASGRSTRRAIAAADPEEFAALCADAAGDPPVPGLDGGPAPGAGRASSRRSTTGTPSGSGPRPTPGKELLRAGAWRCRASASRRRRSSSRCWPSSSACGPRAGRQAVGRLRRGRATARSPTSSTRLAAEGARLQEGEEGRREGRALTADRLTAPRRTDGAECSDLTRRRGRMTHAALDVNGPCRAPQAA